MKFLVIDANVWVAASDRTDRCCELSRRFLVTAAKQETPLMVHATGNTAIEEALTIGTEQFLRAGDAVYAALAGRVQAQLVSWDKELVSKANAVTPERWLKERA